MLVDGGRECSIRAWYAAAVIAGTSSGRHEFSRGAFCPLGARMLVDGGCECTARAWRAAAVLTGISSDHHEFSRGALCPVRTGLRIPATECVGGAAGADLVGTIGALRCYKLPWGTGRQGYAGSVGGLRAVCSDIFPWTTRRPVRTGLRILATECVCGAAGADLVGTAGAVCCYKLSRGTGHPIRATLRIITGGISTGSTALAGSVGDVCPVCNDKLPRNTGRPIGAALRVLSGGIRFIGTA